MSDYHKNSPCWTRCAGGKKYKRKARVLSPGQALRYIANQDKRAYLCPECGYVHIGRPMKVKP